LDEFCANFGYHRKYAIRLLNGAPPENKPVRRRRRRRRVSYGAQVISILEAVWEAADYPWSLALESAIAAVDAVDTASFSPDGGNRRTTASYQPRLIDYRLRSRKRVSGRGSMGARSLGLC